MLVATDSKRLTSVQAMRALAAGTVLVMHTLNYATAGWPNTWLSAASSVFRQFGHAGVDVFFVISGFIIAEQAAKASSPVEFAVRRVARVYPLFWLTLTAMILIPLYPGKSQEPVTISSLFLLTSPPQHPVAWTLVYEIYFYAVGAVCLCFGRFAKSALLAWCLLQTVAVAIRWPDTYFVSPLSLEFCLGVGVAFGSKRIRLPTLIAPAAVGWIVAFGLLHGGSVFATDQWTRLIVWGVPSALLLWSMISYEARGGRVPNVVVACGDISYSMYMWHVPVLSLAWMIWRESLGDAWVGVIYVIGSVVASVVIAFASWSLVEQPINLQAGRLFRRDRPEPLPPQSVAVRQPRP